MAHLLIVYTFVHVELISLHFALPVKVDFKNGPFLALLKPLAFSEPRQLPALFGFVLLPDGSFKKSQSHDDHGQQLPLLLKFLGAITPSVLALANPHRNPPAPLPFLVAPAELVSLILLV